MKRFARIAVRPDNEKDPEAGCLILGLTHGAVFKPGHVYEIVEILGEHIIRDMGVSAASVHTPRYGPSWSNEVGMIISDGRHLLTASENALKSVLDTRCTNCTHHGRDHRLDFKCLFNTTYFAMAVEGW